MLNNKSKQKQPKQKKTTEQKRLIAAQIAMYCFAAMVLSSAPAVITRSVLDKDIMTLDSKQDKIYKEFMACDEFTESFKEEFTKISNDYTNGVITYEQFDEKVKHLNSVKYAQEVLKNSNNTEFKTQIEDIDKQKQERSEQYDENLIRKISVNSTLASGFATIASLVGVAAYGIKEELEEKKKAKQNSTTGVKYYDANSGKVKQVKHYDYTTTVIENPVDSEIEYNDYDTTIIESPIDDKQDLTK